MADKVYFPHIQEIVLSMTSWVVALCSVFFVCANVSEERAASTIKALVRRNSIERRSLTLKSPVVTICTTCLKINNSAFYPQNVLIPQQF
jgi:hypothetical protein